MNDTAKPKRDSHQERLDLIQDLRSLVLEHRGPVEESPYYDQLARLLVSECMIGNYPR